MGNNNMGTWAKAADIGKSEIAMSRILIGGPETRDKKNISSNRSICAFRYNRKNSVIIAAV